MKPRGDRRASGNRETSEMEGINVKNGVRQECESSSAGSDENQKRNLVCHCNKPVIVLKSWTDENPGRKFYRCPRFKSKDSCNYFRWFDEGKVGGWPRIALIEARDELRDTKFEVKKLTDIIKKLEEENRRLAYANSATDSGIREEIESLECDFERIKNENVKLKSENVRLRKQLKQTEKENKGLRMMFFPWMFCMLFMFIVAYVVLKLFTM